jgi:ribosomal protein L37AE/L43A
MTAVARVKEPEPWNPYHRTLRYDEPQQPRDDLICPGCRRTAGYLIWQRHAVLGGWLCTACHDAMAARP